MELWATAARRIETSNRALTFAEARRELQVDSGKPVLILFGTGWGLASGVLSTVDALLEPIAAATGGYNHLSVRAACAIALDRLCGAR